MVALSSVKLQTTTANADSPGCKVIEPWRFQVVNRPVCIIFHGLGDADLKIQRIAGVCDEYVTPVKDIDTLEEGCEYLFTKPGLYEVRDCDGSDDMPEAFFPEVYTVSVHWATLMCIHDRTL